jgi:beta-xylosidase
MGGAIDPFPFVDDDGRRYLLWKSDGNAVGLETWIHIQPLSPDGLRLEGSPTRLIRGDLPWEGGLVEAPTLLKRSGRYHLFYSAICYGGPEYAIGWAVADALMGPYRKAAEPIARTTAERGRVVGPGGQDVVSTPDGRTWLVYHAWDRALSYRAMNVDELTWESGRPVVRPSSGVARETPLPSRSAPVVATSLVRLG